MDVNDRMCAAVGYTRDELLSMTPPADIVPEDYMQELHARLKKQNMDAYGEFELLNITKDGREMPVEVKVHLLEIESGPIILATATDVTERSHRDRILKAQRDVAVSLNHAGDSEEAVRMVIGFALEISSLDAGAFYVAGEDDTSFSLLYSAGFSDGFLSKNETIRIASDGITAMPEWKPVYGSAQELVRAGMIRSSGKIRRCSGFCLCGGATMRYWASFCFHPMELPISPIPNAVLSKHWSHRRVRPSTD